MKHERRTLLLLFAALVIASSSLLWGAEDTLAEARPNPNSQVTLCHIPPGHPANALTIDVTLRHAAGHLRHGDHLGRCKPLCGGTLEPGDIVMTGKFISDAGYSFPGVYRVDPQTGVQSLIASGGSQSAWYSDLIVDGSGNMVVQHHSRGAGSWLAHIDPVSGSEWGDSPYFPNGCTGLAEEADGSLLTARQDRDEGMQILRTVPNSTSYTVVSSRDLLTGPQELAVNINGDIYVTNTHYLVLPPNPLFFSTIVKVEPLTGDQTLVHSSPIDNMFGAFAFDLDEKNLVVVDNLGPDPYQSQSSSVLRINTRTGASAVMWNDDHQVADIDVFPNGDLLILDHLLTDEYQAHPRLLRVDRHTGTTSTILDGGPSLANSIAICGP